MNLSLLLASACLVAALSAPMHGAVRLPPRPRVILPDDRLPVLHDFIANNTEAAAYFAATLQQGEWVLSVPPFYVHGNGSTNDLGGARQVLQRVYTTCLLFRLTRNETWAARALAELESASRWFDWAVTSGGLVTAELNHAFAVGIDWLELYWQAHPDLAAANRSALITAQVQLGMLPMFIGYTQQPPAWANNNTFINATNCYGLVVNGGAIIGALGLLGEDTGLVPGWVADTVFPAALEQAGGSYASYAPRGDGSWFEGPNYSLYSARYLVPTVAALQSVLGDDFGILAFAGLESAAEAFTHSLSPQFTLWNWADTDEVSETTAANLPLAAWFNNSGVAAVIRAMIDTVPVLANETGDPAMQAPIGLIYFTALGSADPVRLPLDKAFYGRDLVTFRSDWSTPNATYAAAKAGTNGGNVHLHQDAGSFIFHAAGRRFIADLGRDSYALFCYFCPPIRWQYYRLNAFGHNTVTFNNATHDWPATAHLLSFNSTGDGDAVEPPRRAAGAAGAVAAEAWATMDLTPAYASLQPALRRWTRGVAALGGRSQLLVVDEFDVVGGLGESGGVTAVNLTWAVHSNASVAVEQPGGTQAVLTVDGVSATLLLLGDTQCPGARLAAVPVVLAPPQLPSDGIVRIEVFVAQPSACSRIAVTVGLAPTAAFTVKPLAQWAASGPIDS